MVLQVGDCLVLQVKGWEVLQAWLVDRQVVLQADHLEELQQEVVSGLIDGL